MAKFILCAVDGSPHAERAIAVAAEIAKATGATLDLFAVDQVVLDGRSAPIHRLGEEGVHALLHRAEATAVAAGYATPRLTAAAGHDVVQAILDYAQEHGVDHIVVGTGEKGAATRLVLGSVSHDLVVRAHCSVTVAR